MKAGKNVRELNSADYARFVAMLDEARGLEIQAKSKPMILQEKLNLLRRAKQIRAEASEITSDG